MAGLVHDALAQARQLYDAMDPVILVPVVYLAVRGRKHLKGVRFGVLTPTILCCAYILLFGWQAGGWVQERYYRPIIPFGGLLAAAGYWCFIRDVRHRKALLILLAVLVGASVLNALKEPIRWGRRPQALAGVWLRQYDPTYKGIVVSGFPQPAYAAGMEFFDSQRTEHLFLDFVARGGQVKYIIVDGGDRGNWEELYATNHGWPMIYRSQERDIRIYQNPAPGEHEIRNPAL